MPPTVAIPRDLWSHDPWPEQDFAIDRNDQSFFSSDKGPSSSSGEGTPPPTKSYMKWADIQDLEEACSTNDELTDFVSFGVGSFIMDGVASGPPAKEDNVCDLLSWKPPETEPCVVVEKDNFEVPAKPKGKVKIRNRKLYADAPGPRQPSPSPPPSPRLSCGGNRPPAAFAESITPVPASWQGAAAPPPPPPAPSPAAPALWTATTATAPFRAAAGAAPAPPERSSSSKHKAGACKQCLFYFSSVGCNKGDACAFCHISHTHCGSARPSKAKRERYRRLFAAIATTPEVQDNAAAVPPPIKPAAGKPVQAYAPLTTWPVGPARPMMRMQSGGF